MKYYVDERSGCIAIRECLPDGQEYSSPGLNEESEGVVHFWNGGTFVNGFWQMDSEFVKKVYRKCAVMNGELAPTPPKAYIRYLRIANIKTTWGDTHYDFHHDEFGEFVQNNIMDDPKEYFEKALYVIDLIIYGVTADLNTATIDKIEWDYLPSDDL